MPIKSLPSSNTVYQLKITLLESHPPIWRRVLVPGSFSLLRLHNVVQRAMDWTDSHLHQFIIDRQHYSIPSNEDVEPVIDERRFSVEQVAPRLKCKFTYEYDFGDSWMHELVVEKIISPVPGEKYPQCIDGQRACPPEDVGGVGGYEEFLNAIRDVNHEEHESFLEWIGGEFDPEAFDLKSANRALQRMK